MSIPTKFHGNLSNDPKVIIWRQVTWKWYHNEIPPFRRSNTGCKGGWQGVSHGPAMGCY